VIAWKVRDFRSQNKYIKYIKMNNILLNVATHGFRSPGLLFRSNMGHPAQAGVEHGLRTAHLAATGVLLGGHVFDVAEARLRLALYLSIATGLGLVVIEAYPGSRWFTQG
jgi:hypothetical protein